LGLTTLKDNTKILEINIKMIFTSLNSRDKETLYSSKLQGHQNVDTYHKCTYNVIIKQQENCI